MKKLNIAYLRCSTDIQDTMHQEKSIQEYCSRNDITIDKTIKDEGVSAFSKDVTARVGFSEILHLGHLGQIDNLVVFESSRISRQFIEGQTLIDELTKCNVVIHSVMDNAIINQNELDQLFNSFKFFMNMKASRETSARIKSSKKLAKEQGKFLGGRQLWGFTVVDGKEVIDEGLREQVIDFFNTYINEGSSEVMNKYNISSHQVLMQKLKNEKYKQIIGEAKFNQVQNTITNRTTSRKGNVTRNTNKSDIIYEGLLYHSCGNKLAIDRNRKGEVVFRCKKCKGNSNITIKKSFIGATLMQNIDEEIKEAIDTLDKDKLEEQYRNRCIKDKSMLSYKIKELNSLLSNKQKILSASNDKLEQMLLIDANENLLNVLADRITITKKEIDDIQNELEDKEKELANIEYEDRVHKEIVNSILEIKTIYSKASNIKKRAILNVLVKKIIVYDIDKFNIYMNIDGSNSLQLLRELVKSVV